MAIKDETKKRSTVKRGSLLDLPPGVDQKKFAYRWISKTRLEQASDGYEPRNYGLYKTEDGKHVSRGDLVLGFKSREEADEDKAYLQQLAEQKMKTTLQNQKEQDDKLAYEIKQSGGKITFNYGEE